MAEPNPDILLTEGRASGGGEVRYHIDIGGKGFEVFFRSADVPLYSGVEPALPLALLGAMRTRSDIRVLSPVSHTYAENMRRVIGIYTDWFSQFSQISIHAENRVEASPPNTGRTGIFFSGGVDSLYTLLSHVDKITDLIYVHGFDVRLDDLYRRQAVADMGRAAAEATETRFIEIESNLGKIVQEYGQWSEHGFGLALAAVGRTMQGYVDSVFIASGEPYQNLRPWGSHPATDPLFGDEALTVVHHGCEAGRVEKIEAITDNHAAMKHLRVCTERVEGKYNCGECEKCLGTMVTLYSLGVLDQCEAFTNNIDVGKLRHLAIYEPTSLQHLKNNIRLLQDRGLNNTEIFKALKHLEMRPRWIARALYRYRRKKRHALAKLNKIFPK